MKYSRSKGQRKHMVWIKMVYGASTTTTTTATKLNVINKTLMPETAPRADNVIKLESNVQWANYTKEKVEIHEIVTVNDKSLCEDRIIEKVQEKAWKSFQLQKRLSWVLEKCMELGYHPKIWRQGIILVDPNSKKSGYLESKSYWTNSLLKMAAKVLKKRFPSQSDRLN